MPVGDTSRWLEVHNGNVVLAVRRFGGAGDPVLLLHGLAGHSEEWTAVAESLTENFRVFALDLRGHGHSDRHPGDVSPDAYCSDVLAVAGALVPSEPLHVVGQSFGGHIAFLVAARNPRRVRSLTVIEADPDGPKPEIVGRVARWLSSWPRPFPSRDAAIEFFGPGPAAEAWVDGLAVEPDGYWPRFDDLVLMTALEHVAARSWWDEWKLVTCPTSVIRGELGQLPVHTAAQMISVLRRASVSTVAGAGHDVHLDRPDALVRELRRSLVHRR